MHPLQTNNQNFINKSKTIYNFITDIWCTILWNRISIIEINNQHLIYFWDTTHLMFKYKLCIMWAHPVIDARDFLLIEGVYGYETQQNITIWTTSRPSILKTTRQVIMRLNIIGTDLYRHLLDHIHTASEDRHAYCHDI